MSQSEHDSLRIDRTIYFNHYWNSNILKIVYQKMDAVMITVLVV